MAPLAAAQFAIFVNGTEVPGTRSSQPLGLAINLSATICIPTDGSTIEVRNVGTGAVALSNYSVAPSLSATVVIQQLSANTCNNL